jgi:valyl-tRNA synthetase
MGDGSDGDVSAALSAEVSTPIDRALLASLATLVDDASAAFDSYDYARALERTERFFWGFCDDYVELVKQRAYGPSDDPGAVSARAALGLALSTLLRLFAPHLPFVTEEVWSWWREGSVHRAAWPDSESLRAVALDGDPGVYEVAAEVVGEVRKAKSASRRSLRTEAEVVVVRDAADRLARLRGALGDVRDAARARSVELVEDDAFGVEVELSDVDAA